MNKFAMFAVLALCSVFIALPACDSTRQSGSAGGEAAGGSGARSDAAPAGPTTNVTSAEQALIDAEAKRIAANAQAKRDAEAEAKRIAELEREREANSNRIAADALSHFPVKFDALARVDVGGRRRSFWAGAKGQVSKNGRVDFVHVVETKEAFSGFTGFALVRFKDAAGNVVWDYKPAARGVNGTSLPGGAPSRRAEAQTFTLDPAVLFFVRSVEVIPMASPQDTASLLKENLDKARKFAEDNKANWEFIAKIIAAAS